MKLLFLTLSLLFQFIAYAQVPLLKSYKFFGGNKDETVGGIYSSGANPINTFISEGNTYIIGGNTDSYNNGDIPPSSSSGNIWVAKVDSTMNIVWKITIGGNVNESIQQILLTNDGGYLILATVFSSDRDTNGTHGQDDVWIIKLNYTGNIVWQKYYGGSERDYATGITKAANNGYIFTASSKSNDGDVVGMHKNVSLDGSDLWVVNIDSVGNILWNKCLGGIYDEGGGIIKSMLDGNFIICGYATKDDSDVHGAHPGTIRTKDIWILKIDKAGNILRQKCIGGTGEEFIGNLEFMPDGGLMVAGSTSSKDGDVIGFHNNGCDYCTDAWVVRLDSTEQIKWQKCFGGLNWDFLNNIQRLPDNTFIACGLTISTDGDISFNHGGAGDYWVVKFSDSGNLIWEKTFGGSGDENSYSLLTAINNDILVFGNSNSKIEDTSHTHGGHDFWLIRIGSTSTLKGTVFYDVNRNGIKDAFEKVANDIFVTATKDNISRETNTRNGRFSIDVDTGTFNTTAVHPYYTSVPASKTSNFSSYRQIDSFSFAMQPIANKKDLMVSIVPLTPARRGFEATYKVYYQNNGTTEVPTGQIVFKKDSRLDFISSFPVASSSTGDTLKWDFLNLNPADTGFIILKYQVGQSALKNGDTLKSIAFIAPVVNDETPNDDTSSLKQVVISSRDPNDKYENHGGVITPQLVKNGEYLNYTIRFQNTGMDTAFNIVVRDTLENRLDWNTLQMITSSHSYNLTAEDGNKLTWTFSNIHLPDSNKNEPASHGFLMYRIKPKSSVAVGNTIKNGASIYFDYNLPVQTNIHNSIVKNDVVTAVPDVPITSANFKIFPNPTDNMLYIKVEEQVRGQAYLSVIDIKGIEVLKKNLGVAYLNNGYVTSLNLNRVASGAYTVILYVGNKIYRQKLIVK